jgi:cytosine/adenosine deaminase-related metal-dependent hydrolase
MNSGFLLRNGTVVNGDRCFRADVRVRSSRIKELGADLKPSKGEVEIDCSNCFIYPGLINSHDHLEFNLFSRLGEPPYANAYKWGDDLHRRWKADIAEIEKVPFRYRLWWGAWKNLLSGVTRVVHHNPYYSHFRLAYPVDVVKRYTWAHSLRFDPDLPGALSRRKPKTPFIIHLAEGRDDESLSEVAELDKLGGIDERTVAIHAMAIGEQDIQLFIKRRVSVVWCPSSNAYLFGRTAPVQSLYGRVPVALGTDSSLSGGVSMFDELRVAQGMSSLSSQQLFEMVTAVPRNIFNLPSDAGTLQENGRADLFVVSAAGSDPYDRLFGCNPGDIQLLVSKGRVVLSDPKINWRDQAIARPLPLFMNGNQRYIWSKTFGTRFGPLKRYLGHYSFLRCTESVTVNAEHSV